MTRRRSTTRALGALAALGSVALATPVASAWACPEHDKGSSSADGSSGGGGDAGGSKKNTAKAKPAKAEAKSAARNDSLCSGSPSSSSQPCGTH